MREGFGGKGETPTVRDGVTVNPYRKGIYIYWTRL